MRKIHEERGYEFFVQYDKTAEVYELFLDENGETYIGAFDTVKEAKRYSKEYMAA